MKKKAEILMLLLSVSLNIVCIYILYIPVNFIELQELFKKFKYCIKKCKKKTMQAVIANDQKGSWDLLYTLFLNLL